MQKIITIIIDEKNGQIEVSSSNINPFEMIGVSKHLKDIGKQNIFKTIPNKPINLNK
jgi:hypothetical protein